MLDLIKFAAYLDEAHEDPDKASEVLRKHKIFYAGLKSAWNHPIYQMTDANLSKLRQTLINNDIQPFLIYTDIGNVSADLLGNTQKADALRVMELAVYFKATYVKFDIGLKKYYHQKVGYMNYLPQVVDWMRYVQDLSIRYSVVPLFEYSRDSYLDTHDVLISQITAMPKWKLIFDPAHYVQKANIDIVDKIWKHIKDYVGVFEMHDYKTGYGHKPVGHGNTDLLRLLNNARSNLDLWYILKPSLGRKYGGFKTKEEVFDMACDALKHLMEISDD